MMWMNDRRSVVRVWRFRWALGSPSSTSIELADVSSMIHQDFGRYSDFVVTATFMGLMGGRTKVHDRKVTSTDRILLFIPLNFFENEVSRPTYFSFHLFQYEVICRCDLIMLIILNVDHCLIEKVPFTFISYLFSHSHISNHFGQCVFDYWNIIFANHYPFHFRRFDLIVPIMCLDIFDCVSGLRVSVQNFLNQILAIAWNETWY